MIPNADAGRNPEVEQRLLAALIAGDSTDVHAAAGAGLTAESFADIRCRSIWQAMSMAVGAGEGVGIDAIARYMQGAEKLSAGAIAALSEVAMLQPTSISCQRLTRDVLGMARRRRLVAATASAASEAYAGSHKDFEEAWEATEPHLRAAMEVSSDTRSRSIEEMTLTARDQILRAEMRPIVPTGFDGWDRVATAPEPGQLIVIAARPGGGKSAFAAQIAHHVATKGGKPVALFSLEMSGEEIVKRMARLRAFPRPPMDHTVADELTALSKLKTLRIYEVEHARTLSQIESITRLLAASPRGLGAVVVDYLQLVAPPADSKRENREQQVAAMSRAFKLLARTVKAPIYLLAQLNREVEKDDGREPRLSDLRESGSIEQDADRVWFLYRPKDDAAAVDSPTIDVVLLQSKCRNGPAGIRAKLKFHRQSMAFTNS